MYSLVCTKINDDIFTELLNYSNKIHYVFPEQDELYYGSAGLSHVVGSKTPELDVVDGLNKNDDVNKNTFDFILNDNIPYRLVEFINKVKGPYSTGKIRFSKMMPNACISWHVDLNCENITRIHIPILTNNKSKYFYKNDAGLVNVVHFKIQSMYALNVNYLHAVRNNGTSPRIHMIINVNTDYETYLHYANSIKF